MPESIDDVDTFAEALDTLIERYVVGPETALSAEQALQTRAQHLRDQFVGDDVDIRYGGHMGPSGGAHDVDDAHSDDPRDSDQ